jgi:hypothetical protein
MDYRQTVGLLLAAAGMAFAADREWEEVIQRTAAKVTANSRSMNSYTCVETVQRDYYRPRASTLPRECPVLMQQRAHPTLDMALLLAERDRLRLEIAATARGEIQAWPGASKFAENDISSLVREGPIGTGAFGTLLNLIFLQDAKKFDFAGETNEYGHRLLIYRFNVPVSNSHYRVRAQDKEAWIAVGYAGTLHVDAATADPIRIAVVVNDLPRAANMCQTEFSMVLKRDAGIGADLLLPVEASQHFLDPTGGETHNTISFSGCRQFSSESTIKYYAPPEPDAATRRAMAKLGPPTIPERLPFSMELLSTIDSETSAAGDRFTARLAAPVRDGRRVIAPKGAIVEGRVSDVEIGYRPEETVAIGLIPESIEIHGMKVPFGARLDYRREVVLKEQKRRKGLAFFLPKPGEYPHMFRLPGTHNVLKRGFVSDWLTVTCGAANPGCSRQ